MAKTKVSQFDAVASNNTDINSVNVAEGCPPSGINNAIREMASLLKKQEVGTDAMTSPDIDGGTIDGATIGGSSGVTIGVSDGTVSAPSIKFTGDTNTGIYRGGTDILKFVTAGTDAITIDASQNVGVGIGTADGKVHIHTASAGSVTANSASNELVLENSGDAGLSILSPNANNSQILLGSPVANAGGIIRWTGDDNAVKIGTNNTGSTLRFHVGGFSEVMRIDSSGRVMIGNTTEGVAGADELTVGNTSAGNGITIRSASNSSGALFFSDGTSGSAEYDGGFEYNHSSQFMRISTAGSEQVRIDSSGNVGIGTSSPSTLLMVEPSARTTNFSASDFTTYADILVKNPSDDSTCATGIAFITDASTYTNGASGIACISGSGDSESSLAFITRPLNAVAAERMRITSAGNVGIGNTAMSSLNSEANNLVVGTGSGSEGITIYTGSSAGHYGSIFFADGTDSNAEKRGQIRYEHNNEIMSFYTNVTERMRIDSSGKLLINTTSTLGSGQGVLHLKGASANTVCVVQVNNNGEKGLDFRNASGTQVGHITINASDTAFSTSSDYRLKENVDYTFDATTRLKQLKPARFNFIADADTTVDGFLAHEVQSVVPEAITGTHNEVDDDGNPVYQGIDQSKLVPLLVKTIQELEARIVALETA